MEKIINDINFFKKENSYYFKRVRSKEDVSMESEFDGYLLDAKEAEARRIIDKLKGSNKKIALVGGDLEINRRALEKMRINYLVSPERKSARHSLKQRDSGFNHVLARISREKNIPIVVDISELLKLGRNDLPIRLAQLIQNIKIARRENSKICIASFSRNEDFSFDKITRMSFGISLGMSTSQARESVKF